MLIYGKESKRSCVSSRYLMKRAMPRRLGVIALRDLRTPPGNCRAGFGGNCTRATARHAPVRGSRRGGGWPGALATI